VAASPAAPTPIAPPGAVLPPTTPTAVSASAVLSAPAPASITAAPGETERQGYSAPVPDGGTIHGTVLGPGRVPDMGARIIVTSSPGPDAARKDIWHAAPVSVSADGSYRIVGVKPGHVEVHVYSTRFADPEEAELDLGSRQVVRHDFVLEAGAAIAGRAHDRAGKPLAGIQVSSLWPHRESTTDAEGRFRLEGLNEEMQMTWLEAKDPTGKLAKAKVTARVGDEAVDILMEAGARIEGIVVDKATRAPVAGVTVRLGGGMGFFGGMDGGELTDAKGRFNLDGVPAGSGRALRASKVGFAPAEARVDLAPGATVAVEIELGAGAVARGIVRGPRGEPVAGALVVEATSSEFARAFASFASAEQVVAGW
jgi:hypothetical protein